MGLHRVEEGLVGTLAELPVSHDFVLVASRSGSGYRKARGGMCYYGQASVAIGSFLPEEQAFAGYIDQLESHGWRVKRELIEVPGEHVLLRGEYETLTVRIGAAGWMMQRDEGFQRAQTIFPTFVHVFVDYTLPNRKLCLGM
jgi:hypothetical protein